MLSCLKNPSKGRGKLEESGWGMNGQGRRWRLEWGRDTAGANFSCFFLNLCW